MVLCAGYNEVCSLMCDFDSSTSRHSREEQLSVPRSSSLCTTVKAVAQVFGQQIQTQSCRKYYQCTMWHPRQ